MSRLLLLAALALLAAPTLHAQDDVIYTGCYLDGTEILRLCGFIEPGPPTFVSASAFPTGLSKLDVAANGGKAAYSYQVGLWVANVDGTGAVRVLDGVFVNSLALSPDASKIAFTDGAGVHVLDVASGIQTLIVAGNFGGNNVVEWSPDATRVLYSISEQPRPNLSTNPLFIVSADGSAAPTRLTFPETAAPVVGFVFDSHADWSSDGGSIAFIRFTDDRPFGGPSTSRFQIFRLPATGGELQELFNQTGTAEGALTGVEWSPNGSKLAVHRNYVTDTSAGWSVSTMPATGGALTLVYTGVQFEGGYLPQALIEWAGPPPLSDIVVTTTGDEPNLPASASDDRCDVDSEEPEDQCTLRAAIELANDRGGARITFDIPGEGVPRIRVTEYTEIDGSPFNQGLPTFDSQITLDGTTQPGGWVELAGEGFPRAHSSSPVADGIRIGSGGSGSTVRGLVINRFIGSGIHLLPGADGCTIEGNRIGTDVSGIEASGTPPDFYFLQDEYGVGNRYLDLLYDDSYPLSAGVRLGSSGNMVRDNLVVGNANHGTAGDLYNYFFGGVDILIGRGTVGNVIRRNRIGVGANGEVVQVTGGLVDHSTINPDYQTKYIGILVQGSGHTIGGGPGEGNVIAGHSVDVLLRGASGNTVSWNQIGQVPPESIEFLFNEGIVLTSSHNVACPSCQLGDPEAPPGRGTVENNTVSPRGNPMTIRGAYDVSHNTIVRCTVDFVEPGCTGPEDDAAVSILGGDVQFVENEVRSSGWGLDAPPADEENEGAQIVIAENDFSEVGRGIWLGSVPSSQRAVPQRAVITRNRIVSRGIGIDLSSTDSGHPDGVTPNDFNDSDSGPNDLLNFPDILAATVEGGVVHVRGFIEAPVLDTAPYFVEVFSNPACTADDTSYLGGQTYGPGAHYLGVGGGNASLGYVDFDVSLSDLPPGHTSVSLTATRLDLGVTSEFSQCLRLVGAGQVASATVGPDQTGPLLDAVGTTVSSGSAARPSDASARDASGGEALSGGTLFVTRYDARPERSVFADITASAPNGAQVHPETVAERNWRLADRGLTPAGGAPAPTRTFDVCLRAEGTVLSGSLDAVVVVQRDAATGGLWEPRATTREDHGGEPYLCAAGLTALGEMGLGGSAAAFPVAGESGPDDAAEALPSSVRLAAWPNPTSGRVTVEVSVPAAGTVRAEVVDALGRCVAVLHDGPLAAGVHALPLDGSRLPSGVYVVRLQAGDTAAVRRLTVVR